MLNRIRAYPVVQALSRHAMLVFASLLLIFTGLFIWRQSAQFGALGNALQGANRLWIAAALLLQIAVLCMAGITYRVVLRRLGHELPWWSLVRLQLQRQVVGTVTPAGGPASVYVFVRALGERGVPADDALLATSLRSVAGYSAFVTLLAPVLILYRPSPLILSGAGLLAAICLVMAVGLVLILRQPADSTRRLPFVPGRVQAFVARTRGHRICPCDFLKPFGLMLTHNLAGATLLYLCLRAVGQHPAPTTALIGFVIGMLLVMVAPVFGGIGIVEVTMALVLRQLGVPSGAAAGAAILFRMAELWLPLSVGLLIQAAALPVLRQPREWAVGAVRDAPTLARHASLVGALAGGATLAALTLGYQSENLETVGALSIAAIVAGAVMALRARRPLAAFATAAGALAVLPGLFSLYVGPSVAPDMLVQLVQRLG